MKLELEQVKSTCRLKHIKKLLPSSIDGLDESFYIDNNLLGINTGFIEFDKLTQGLQKGQLSVIAGRPTMGTSTFLINILEYTTTKLNLNVAYFSTHISTARIQLRLLSSLSGIRYSILASGTLHNKNSQSLSQAISMLNNANIYIDDSNYICIEEIIKQTSILKKEKNLDLILIDSFHDICLEQYSPSMKKSYSIISKQLKILAKELNVPIMVSSRVKRSVENRPNFRPSTRDIYKPGTLEVDADLIGFIYRDDLYFDGEEVHPNRGKAEIIIDKHRYGERSTFMMDFNGKCCHFENQKPVSVAPNINLIHPT